MANYHSTGKGGWFFNNIYEEAFSLETIRKVPCTIEELSNEGLTPQEIEGFYF